jgi:hypothetical protein
MASTSLAPAGAERPSHSYAPIVSLRRERTLVVGSNCPRTLAQTGKRKGLRAKVA